jgi:alpha-1,6-mannosyltransferase
MHLVDTTLFYSPTSGGVKRYLTAKHAWLRANTGWKHTILVPGEAEHVEHGGVSSVPGYPWPGTFNYRLPLNPRRWARLLDQLEPDLIEAGDAFHPAWCAWRVARRRQIPLAAFYHSNMPQIIARRIGAMSERVLGRYVRWLYERFDVVFAPSRLMCQFLNSLGVYHTMHQPLGVDADVFSPARRTLDLRAKLGLPQETRLLAYAGRFSGEKNLSVLLHAFARLGRPYHLLMIVETATRGRRRMSRSCNTAATVMSSRNGSLPRTRWCTPARRKPSASSFSKRWRVAGRWWRRMPGRSLRSSTRASACWRSPRVGKAWPRPSPPSTNATSKP